MHGRCDNDLIIIIANDQRIESNQKPQSVLVKRALALKTLENRYRRILIVGSDRLKGSSKGAAGPVDARENKQATIQSPGCTQLRPTRSPEADFSFVLPEA